MIYTQNVLVFKRKICNKKPSEHCRKLREGACCAVGTKAAHLVLIPMAQCIFFALFAIVFLIANNSTSLRPGA
jgi:hypothetical protein